MNLPPKHSSRRTPVQTSEHPRLGQKFHSFGEATVNQIAIASAFIVIVLGIPAISPEVAAGAAPAVVTIDHNPQFFIDDYLVDNRWGVRFLTETVTRVSHQPSKDIHNPVIAGKGGYVNVARDERTGLFRMWYQDYWDQSLNPRKYTYGIAYAESTDGIHWKLPRIGKYDFKGTRDNNIVLLGPENGRAETPFLLDVPHEHRRGYEYLMLYTTNVRGKSGMHVIGSKDGIAWDSASDVRIAADFTPDTQASIVWDPRHAKFVCFTRATNIYRAKGERRKIARLENNSLWGAWPVTPENILLPDSLDARTGHNYFYGMPTRYYAGIYWGFLWPYRHQEDIYTELAFSRDGRNFQRFPDRPRLIDLGPDKSWDGGMVLGSPTWIEVGDQWWIYYTATNEAHKSRTPTPGIGLARIRKEGFVSLRSPPGGGFVVTRLLRWPGGRLFVNADVCQSEMTVRITDYNRQPLKNFDSGPSLPIIGDSVHHEVRWKKGDIRDLKGLAIRIEFFMKSRADLYSFRAGPPGDNP